MSHLGFRLLALLALCTTVSCNVYGPFASPHTEADWLEEARKCLHDGDYECAAAAYQELPSGPVKNEKLCVVNLARSGINLDTLVSVVTNSNTGQAIVARIASAMLPFSSEKLAAAEAALDRCAMVTGDVAPLLRALSLLGDCSIRIARADRWVATDGAVVDACNANVPGNRSGTIDEDDIGGDPILGDISPGTPGMCAFDVLACVANLSELGAMGAELSGAGLGSIVGNVNALPVDLLDDSTGADAGRLSLRSTVQ